MLKSTYAPQPKSVRGSDSEETTGPGCAPHCGHHSNDTKQFLWSFVDPAELDDERPLDAQLRELWDKYLAESGGDDE